MMDFYQYMELCRLRLVREKAIIPIFENEGSFRHIYFKIVTCLSVGVSKILVTVHY